MPEMCNCEHTDHFPDLTGNPAAPHEYMKVPAGEQVAEYVGKICDACANGHLADYVKHPIPDTALTQAQKRGHRLRTGHELTGYMLTRRDPRFPDAFPLSELVKTCCDG